MKTNFSIPGLFNNFALNQSFITLFDSDQNVFNDNFVIDSVYGSFPNSKWGLERYSSSINFKTIEKIINYYNRNGISIHYEMNNPLIREQHLNDEFCNECLKLSHNSDNAVIVASEVLRNYIREKYPNYNIITLTPKIDADFISIMPEDEDLNVIEDKSDYEILLNNFCCDNCQIQDKHINYLANEQLRNSKIYPYFPCVLRFDCGFEIIKTYKHFVSIEMLNEKYIPMGFNNYKIATNTLIKYLPLNCTINDLIKFYVYYLIKPEYQKDVLDEFLIKNID